MCSFTMFGNWAIFTISWSHRLFIPFLEICQLTLKYFSMAHSHEDRQTTKLKSTMLQSTLFFFFFLTSLLEYNCFKIVCLFLFYNKVNQLYIYICPHISSLLSVPPSHPPYPTPLGGHKAPS